jgi:Ni/Fe-hydrogenase subunit HybB-like protein
MPQFRLNKHRINSKENYEYYLESCKQYNYLPSYIDLGQFVYCSTAIHLARTIGYMDVSCCVECCKDRNPR